VAGALGGDRRIPCAPGRQPAAVLRARDVSVPVRPLAHGPRPQLLDRRRHRTPAAHAGSRGPPSDRMGRVRAAGGERGDQARRAPRALDVRQHRPHAGAAPAARLLVRLGARARHVRPAVLPLGAALLPPHARTRPRLQAALVGQLVPHMRDCPGQRAGRRRRVLALRNGGRAARARAVVPPDYGVRRGASPGPRPAARLARAGRRDAAQLDRTERGGGDPVPARGARRRGRGLHHAARHPVRRDVHEPRSRAPARRHPRSGHAARGERRSVRRAHASARPIRAGGRQGRNRDRGLLSPPADRRSPSDLHRELRAHGVRDRRRDGCAGARPARLRIRTRPRPSRDGRRATGGRASRPRHDAVRLGRPRHARRLG